MNNDRFQDEFRRHMEYYKGMKQTMMYKNNEGWCIRIMDDYVEGYRKCWLESEKETESRVNISRVNKQSKDNMNINIINKYNVLWCVW